MKNQLVVSAARSGRIMIGARSLVAIREKWQWEHLIIISISMLHIFWVTLSENLMGSKIFLSFNLFHIFACQKFRQKF
jgi:hypothetical protein